MNYTERVEGFQIRDVCYFGLPPKDTPPRYDIVKWAIADPPYEALDITTGKRKTVTEYCYSVGRLEWNKKEPCFEFRSVGLRWLEAKPSEHSKLTIKERLIQTKFNRGLSGIRLLGRFTKHGGR